MIKSYSGLKKYIGNEPVTYDEVGKKLNEAGEKIAELRQKINDLKSELKPSNK